MKIFRLNALVLALRVSSNLYSLYVLFASIFLYYVNRQRVLFATLLLVLLVEVGFIYSFMSFNHAPDNVDGEAGWTLTHEALLSLRVTASELDRRVVGLCRPPSPRLSRRPGENETQPFDRYSR